VPVEPLLLLDRLLLAAAARVSSVQVLLHPAARQRCHLLAVQQLLLLVLQRVGRAGCGDGCCSCCWLCICHLI
jgi:hypothetical protein